MHVSIWVIQRSQRMHNTGVFFITKQNGNVDVWDLLDRCVDMHHIYIHD